ncbi:hypothetical protein [Streptomyces sp. NPDC008125]|uniref:hypothetical protein n=1 Tax=Streptomyces sp. NPDC008125 TaxID=3364811 RepID=UPI0036EC58DF
MAGGNSRYDAIRSVLELGLVPAAVLRELAGRSSRGSVTRVLAMRDKHLQRRLVRGAGVPTAACEVLEAQTALDPGATAFPKVLKPLDGGARHTYLLTDEKCAHECVELARAGGPGPWLLEEYIHGIEFQVDGFVRHGETRAVLSASRCLQNLIEVHEGEIVAHVVLPPVEYPGLYEEIRAVAETSLQALE